MKYPEFSKIITIGKKISPSKPKKSHVKQIHDLLAIVKKKYKEQYIFILKTKSKNNSQKKTSKKKTSKKKTSKKKTSKNKTSNSKSK